MLLQKENTSFESQRRVKRWPHSLPYNFQGSFPNGDSIERYTNIINITFWNVNKKTGNHKTNWDKYLEMIICINMSIRSQGKQTSQFGMREIIMILAALLLHTCKNTQYNTKTTNTTKKTPWPKGHKNDIGRSSIPNGNFNLFLGAVWAWYSDLL